MLYSKEDIERRKKKTKERDKKREERIYANLLKRDYIVAIVIGPSISMCTSMRM